MTKPPSKTRTQSPIRARMIERMKIGNLAPGTQQHYLRTISNLARDTGTSPDLPEAEQVRAWLVGLIDRDLAPVPTNATLSVLRFFHREVIDRPDVVRGLRNRKCPRRLPRRMTEVEVERLPLATPDLRYRTATLLTCAAGLRISETVAVRIADPVIGYLRGYWQTLWPRPATWLFHDRSPEVPIKAGALRRAFRIARNLAGIDRAPASMH